MKLEVGMYIRTDMGIGKIIIGEEIDFKQLGKSPIRYRERIKSSFNLIDLIEVGDYVNGRKVNAISEGDVKFIIFEDNARLEMTVEEDIKSIVTREQFKSIEYEVK